MSNLNKVAISGNLTRDPELRSSAGGMAFLNFGIAVNDRVKNQTTGEWEDYPNFFDCVCIGARAEALANILTKGTKVAIEGKLRYRTWETPEGDKRSAVSITVNEIDLMSQSGGGSGHGGGGGGSRSSQPAPTPSGIEDDIPF